MTLFRKTSHCIYAKCKFTKDGGAWGRFRDLTGDAREARTVNAGFRRYRIHVGAMKWWKMLRTWPIWHFSGWNLVKINVRGAVSSMDTLPTPFKPMKSSKWLISGQLGNGQKIVYQIQYQTPDQPLKRPVCYEYPKWSTLRGLKNANGMPKRTCCIPQNLHLHGCFYFVLVTGFPS